MNRRSLFKAIAGLAAAPLLPKVEPRYDWVQMSAAITLEKPSIHSGDMVYWDYEDGMPCVKAYPVDIYKGIK